MIQTIEPLKLGEVKVVSTSTTAQDIIVGGKMIVLKNVDSTKAIYFKEKNGVACTSSNGIKLNAGETSFVFTADTLSVIAGEGTPSIDVITFIL